MATEAREMSQPKAKLNSLRKLPGDLRTLHSPEEGRISHQTALKYKIYLSSMFSAAIRLEAGATRNPVPFVRLTIEEPAKQAFILDDLQTQQIAESLEDHATG